jgi:hypothetical protein
MFQLNLKNQPTIFKVQKMSTASLASASASVEDLRSLDDVLKTVRVTAFHMRKNLVRFVLRRPGLCRGT